MKELVCACTGHRLQNLPFRFNEMDERCISLKERLYVCVENIIKKGVTRFVSGMAIGVDLFLRKLLLNSVTKNIRTLHWKRQFPAKHKQYVGRKIYARGIIKFLHNAMLKQYCRKNIHATVCKSETVIWWIAAIILSPYGTELQAEPDLLFGMRRKIIKALL